MGIKLRFERPFVRDNTNRIVANESELVQQANLIATKVSQTDFNGNTISSLINQTATTIKIQAQKIQLEGLVTANNNFKVLLDGSIEAVNGKFSGNINGGTINIGSRFSVDSSGNLVASNAVLSGSIVATRMSASSNPSLYGEIGVADNYPGLALYDLRYNSNPYFKITEGSGGNAVLIRDKNNISRVIFTTGSSNGIAINDSDGSNRVNLSNEMTRVWSPGYTTRFDMTDTYVRIVRNGSIIAQW